MEVIKPSYVVDWSGNVKELKSGLSLSDNMRKITGCMAVPIKLRYFFVLSALITLSILSLDAQDQRVVELTQEDFRDGSYIIDEPGYYKLVEDISFNPNSSEHLGEDAYDSSFPTVTQFTFFGGDYDPKAFGIGFFAAIVIAADNVTIDLNGHRLEQGEEHALMQRFYANIELANMPFIPTQGPHTFGDALRPATNTRIINGTLGRSSHHGIHGNGNKNIVIENVHFEDFEVAAVALNGVHGLRIENSTAKSRQGVPVLGTFSAARFLRAFIDYLVRSGSETTLNVGQRGEKTATELREELRQSINRVHSDLIAKGLSSIDPEAHPEEYALYHNPTGVVDGNCYGYLVNGMGFAVNGFSEKREIPEEDRAKDIVFKNVHVLELTGDVREVVTLKRHEKAVIDQVGAAFQLKNRHPDTLKLITVSDEDDKKAVYVGNVLADCQALIAKAYLNGDFEDAHLDLSRLTIDREILNWIEADPSTPEAKLAALTKGPEGYFCNADSMFHVNKGVIAFRIDAATNVELLDTSARSVTNIGEVCSGACGIYDKSHPKATLEGCGGPMARGYCFASSENVRLMNSHVDSLVSRCGSAVAFDVITDSTAVRFEDCTVKGIEAGPDYHPAGGPQERPKAIGFHVDSTATDVMLNQVKIDGLRAKFHSRPVLDESKRADVRIQRF